MEKSFIAFSGGFAGNNGLTLAFEDADEFFIMISLIYWQQGQWKTDTSRFTRHERILPKLGMAEKTTPNHLGMPPETPSICHVHIFVL